MKAIISLSGGLDSTTMLAEYQDVIKQCVFFKYGSKQNEREFKAVNEIAAYYRKPLKVLDISGGFASFKSALLAHSDEEVELGAYKDKEVSNAVVPYRNGIFASFLVGLAESLNLDTVMLGVHAGDHRLYPDCAPTFIQNLNSAVRAYSNSNIEIFTPLLYYTKADIAAKAIALEAPISLTYSCYLGGDTECGKCPTCIEKQEALGLWSYYEGK